LFVNTDKEIELVRTFFGQGGKGQFFAILCGRLLWTMNQRIYGHSSKKKYF